VTDYSAITRDLQEALQLRYRPVGVTLYGRGDALPEGVAFAEQNLKSYCQALVLAGEGQTLLLRRDQMGCKLGTTVLGFEQESEQFLDDGVLEKYGVGLFESEEASAETILKATYLEKATTLAVLIAPLEACTAPPQVVVFTANSEQIMWLLYAVNYRKGGRMDLPQSGGALGGCSDITALPLVAGITNVTFLGLGCRIKAALDPCHLMLGTPGRELAAVHRHLRAMAKPIAMLNKAHLDRAPRG
jgi:uncharacterized protein (DUF169 family)